MITIHARYKFPGREYKWKWRTISFRNRIGKKKKKTLNPSPSPRLSSPVFRAILKISLRYKCRSVGRSIRFVMPWKIFGRIFLLIGLIRREAKWSPKYLAPSATSLNESRDTYACSAAINAGPVALSLAFVHRYMYICIYTRARISLRAMVILG